eukprot:758901_1
MSLTKAVHFRELITQLTNEERVGFLSQLIDSHVNMILTCLFQHLSKPNQMAQVDDFNQSILDIIQARKDKPKQLCSRDIQFDQFPRAIIGYTASFLDQSDYVKLSVSNRSIYLGCNLPNTLHEIDLTRLKTKNYSSVTVVQFQSIKSLCIDPYIVTAIDRILPINLRFESPNFNQVTTLTLTAKGKTGWVQSFLNQNIVNCDHVTTLKCVRFGSPDVRMQKDELISLLAAFPNLTHLNMRFLQVDDDVTGRDIATACSKVVGFTYMTGVTNHMPGDLVQAFASQLKYLHLMHRNPHHLDNIALSKLEELSLFRPTNRTLNAIFKYALNMRKLYVFWYVPEVTNVDQDGIKTAITNLMVKCKFLNYICFSTSQVTFCSLLDG